MLPPLLFLAHRIPFPPNKGDKLRSFNLLRYLSRRYRIHLATFIDDPADAVHIPRLSEWCESVCCEPLSPSRAKLGSLRGLATGEALSLPYYRSRKLARWIDERVKSQGITHALVFSSSMAQYALAHPGLHTVVDYCDVDSAKWAAYAQQRKGPMAWIYRREGKRLLDFERTTAARTAAVTFVSQAESELFRELAPEVADKVATVCNGVDASFFAPEQAPESPYAEVGQAIVFTGAMDYWPNIDAVLWFAREVWPQLATRHPDLRFYVVGMNPAPEVQALGNDPAIHVTGTVPDVRPYLAHAALAVAPLKIGRGVQNKVLEAMAMARPVVASPDAATGIEADSEAEMIVAGSADAFVRAIDALLADPATAARIGAAARQRILNQYSWDAHLSRLDPLLESVTQ